MGFRVIGGGGFWLPYLGVVVGLVGSVARRSRSSSTGYLNPDVFEGRFPEYSVPFTCRFLA